MTSVLLGTIGYVLLFAFFLLAPAPQPVPWRAWVLLVALFFVRLLGSLVIHRSNPALLRERAKPPIQLGQPTLDRILLLSIMAAFALVVSVASADGFRLHLLGSAPPILATGGLVLFIGGWLFVSYALFSNPFAVLVVRPQEGQAIAVAGPYRFVRHPMYLGVVAVMVGTSLWLQSYLGLVVTIVPILLLVARICLEEQFIRARVPDYQQYALKVPYRLLPFIW